jgi:hypothetical protein
MTLRESVGMTRGGNNVFELFLSLIDHCEKRGCQDVASAG